VEELLVQEVSDIIRREMRDPRLGLLTLTGAEVTPDLRHARIFFTVIEGKADRDETAEILNRAAGFVRREFANRAQMKYVPDIRFAYDSSVARGARISELLEQVRQQDEQRAPESDDSAGGERDPEGD
jgi:ribosome-binding factor A